MSSGKWGRSQPPEPPPEDYAASQWQQATVWPGPITWGGTYADDHEGRREPSARDSDNQRELVRGGPRDHIGAVAPNIRPELLNWGYHGDTHHARSLDDSHAQFQSPYGQEPLRAHGPIASPSQCYGVGGYTLPQPGRGLTFEEVRGGSCLANDRDVRSDRLSCHQMSCYGRIPKEHPFTTIRHPYAVRDPLDLNLCRGDREDDSPPWSFGKEEDITTAKRAILSKPAHPYCAPAPRRTVTTLRQREAAKNRRSATCKAVHSCPYDPKCPATFTRSFSARNHALAHENKQAYACERGCERRFNTHALRKSHYKNMH